MCLYLNILSDLSRNRRKQDGEKERRVVAEIRVSVVDGIWDFLVLLYIYILKFVCFLYFCFGFRENRLSRFGRERERDWI